jgi:hypothetical protein
LTLNGSGGIISPFAGLWKNHKEDKMFGKLKEATGGAAMQKAVDAISPKLIEQTDRIKQLEPDIVRDDEAFTQKFSEPALVAMAAISGGITALIPRFKERFSSAMLHLRDELLVLDGDSVEFVEGFKERLPAVFLAGLKKD